MSHKDDDEDKEWKVLIGVGGDRLNNTNTNTNNSNNNNSINYNNTTIVQNFLFLSIQDPPQRLALLLHPLFHVAFHL
jgi:hypothetical protein